jgi:hypothetical protein
MRSMRALLVLCLASPSVEAQAPTITGEGAVITARRETQFHLLIDRGHAASLSVESGPCARGACTMERHWLFEGPVTNGPEPLRAAFTQFQSRPANGRGIYPMERREVSLDCRRAGNVHRCRLAGDLPPDWAGVPRRFELTMRGM